MEKKILLISPIVQDLYKDLIHELNNQGYDVSFVEDKVFFNRKYYYMKKIFRGRLDQWYLNKADGYYKGYWANFFRNFRNISRFDYLIVIDGLSMCNLFFERLRENNPRIKKILYMFDPVGERFHFDRFFKFFDKKITFDIEVAKKYKIGCLPIWWVPVTENTCEQLDVFGFASFGNGNRRYSVFHTIKRLSEEYHLKSFIKLSSRRQNSIVSFLKKLLRKDLSLLVEQNIISYESISPSCFRRFVCSSNVILDALGQDQDGMTARFSWAIGAGKRIITDNTSVYKYDFYDPNQIIVWKENMRISKSFFIKKYTMSKKNKELVNKFRIDNFVRTLLAV